MSLPPSAQIYSGEVNGGGWSGWSARDEMPAPLSRIEIPRATGTATVCITDFNPTSRRVFDEGVTVLEAVGPSTVLAGSDRGALALVDPNGVSPVGSITSTVGFTASFRAPDGTIWIADRSGRLVQIRFSADLEPAIVQRLRGPGVSVFALAGPRREAPFELFAMSHLGEIAHFDGSGWFVHRSSQDAERASIEWVREGEAVAITGAHVLRVKAGRLEVEPIADVVELTAVRWTPLGILAVGSLRSDARVFFVHDEVIGRWREHGSSRLSIGHILDFAAYRGRLVFVGQLGWAGLYPSAESCQNRSLAARNMRRVVALEDRAIVAGGDGGAVVWLRPPVR